LNRKRASFLLAIPTTMLIVGCGYKLPVHYVSISDPVLSVCQQAAVLNLDNLDRIVDSANNQDYDSWEGATPQSMSPQQQTSLANTARLLTADQKTVRSLHPQLASTFGYEASLLTLASQGNNGFVTNSIAVSLNGYTDIIDNDCGSYQAGTAPVKPSAAPANPGKPGPGFLTSVAVPIAEGVAAYLFISVLSSFLIAHAERKLPRSKRLDGEKLAWAGLTWPITLLVCVISTWTTRLETAVLTPGERREDDLTRVNAELEAENERLRNLKGGDS
jgi:hypothetical protein